MRELIAAKHGDLKDGQMKQVEVGEDKFVLAMVEGQYHAFGAVCPHHGADLVNGLLHDHSVRCPWHHSIFDVTTGRFLEPPSLDDIPQFDVKVEGEDIIVILPDGPLPQACTPRMARPDPKGDRRTFVILGTGAAALTAGETLRQDGFGGRIIMVTRESVLPYDRTELSKRYLAKADQEEPYLRHNKFYDSNGIEILFDHEVTDVAIGSRTVSFRQGPSLEFDRLLIATGGVPRRLGVEGEDLPGVFLLRSFEDCQRIRDLDGIEHVLVVGSAFIGMEVAASIRQRNVNVTVVSPDSVPFERGLGRPIGAMLQRIHEDNGVKFELSRKIDRFEQSAGGIVAHLDDGRTIETQRVIIGIGVTPATSFLRDVPLNRDGSVSVDSRMRMAQDVWAAGDIAQFPDWRTAQGIRIEHWRSAQQLGRCAAHNMTGRDVPYSGVPFFWTFQFRTVIQYVGHATSYDSIEMHGSVDAGQFLAFYKLDERVLAVSGANESHRLMVAAEVMKHPALPTTQELLTEMDRAQQAQLHM